VFSTKFIDNLIITFSEQNSLHVCQRRFGMLHKIPCFGDVVSIICTVASTAVL